jgi:hypothetical protein
MDNAQLKSLRLHNIVFNPALNDGMNGKLRVEANQWILDGGGNVTDVKHRLEAGDVESALRHLADRASLIMQLHVEKKPCPII